MLNPFPKGIDSRLPPDWFYDRMTGADCFVGAVAAQFSYIGLFNDDNAGRSLYCYGLSFNTSPAGNVVIEKIQGKQAGASNLTTFGTTKLDAAKQAGQPYTFSNASCVGTHIGQLIGIQGQGQWNYDWPWAVVPPGMSVLLQSSAVNSLIAAGLWWLAK